MTNKLKSAQEYMGAKWLLHPANRIKKRRIPLDDSAGTDIAKTFSRVRREQREQVERDKAVEQEQQAKVRAIIKERK